MVDGIHKGLVSEVPLPIYTKEMSEPERVETPDIKRRLYGKTSVRYNPIKRPTITHTRNF